MGSLTTRKHVTAATLTVALCLSSPAFAQKTSSGTTDEYPDLVELDPFGGISLWGTVNKGLQESLVPGGTAGGRVAFNVTPHIGLELGYNFMVNNVRLLTPVAPGLASYTFGNQIHYLALNPVFNLTPRGSRFQPYLTVGVGAAQFTPTGNAKKIARDPAMDAIYHSANLNDNLQPALNYGGGVKWHLSPHVGLRLDARGFWSRNPTFGLPNYPTGGIYIPARDHINGFQGTLGLVLYVGQTKCPPLPAAPAPVTLPQPTISGTEGTLCQGKPITLHAEMNGAPGGHTLTYAWTVDGQAQGGNSPDLTITPNNGGTFNVQLTVTDTTPPPSVTKPPDIPERCWVQPVIQPVAPVTATAKLTVSEYEQPQIASVTADPNTLSCPADTNGVHSAALNVQATGSACGGKLTYNWTVSEGSIANNSSPSATFDASSLNFEGGGQNQSKSVTATVTVTDEAGKSAARSTSITVNCPPQFKRLPDIVFAKNNARVNNCGKRILIDQAAQQAGTTYDIVLVGHRASDEKASAAVPRRGRRPQGATRTIDEQRVLNAAAVLTGGHGTCANIDPARIKIDWVGTDQTSTPEPGLCGTSNLPSVKERRSSQVSQADQERRVEVYLVPKGAQITPPAVKNLKPVPEAVIKDLGCPR